MSNRHQRRMQAAQNKTAQAHNADIQVLQRAYMLYQQENNLEAAEQICNNILAKDPKNYISLNLLGLIAYKRRQYETAVTFFQKVIKLVPNFPDAYNELGNSLQALYRYKEAEIAYKQAINLNPALYNALSNLGLLAYKQCDYSLAREYYQKSLQINPTDISSHSNLGITYLAEEKYADAITSFNKALAYDSRNPGIYVNLATALTKSSDCGQALKALDSAMQYLSENTDPELEATISLQSGLISLQYGKIKEASAYFKRIISTPNSLKQNIPSSTYYKAYNNYLMSMLYNETESIQTMHKVSAQFSDIFTPTHTTNTVLQTKSKLRIGYVSGDFREHAVSYFIKPVLAQHNRENFEIFCYHNHPNEDMITAELKLSADHWRNIAAISDSEAHNLIKRDSIDILIDLSGHTAFNRLSLFATKPAPIQISWLGYPGTTGLNAINYIISDKHCILAEETEFYTEIPLLLPYSLICYSVPHTKIDVSPLPALTTGRITFGCFNNTIKLSETTIDTWAQILINVPDSQLYLKNFHFADQSIRAYYLNAFIRHNIDSSRIIFAGGSPKDEYYRSFHHIDIALDPFPYNGGTTSLDTLWMGVPLITLYGDRFVGRIGASLLHNIGLSNLVTHSKQDYIAKAVSLAQDTSFLAELRLSMRERLLNSALFDAKMFTSNLENKFNTIWQDCLATTIAATG